MSAQEHGAGPDPRAAVIVVSDEVSSGADVDRAGGVAVDLLAGHGVAAARSVVPDDVAAIQAAVRAAIASGVRIVLTCGGTGIGPTDVTATAVGSMLAFEMPGIGEEIRRRGADHAPIALVSREVAGIVTDAGPPAFVLAAPGSRGGVRDAIAVVGPLLRHIVSQLDGAGHL